MTFKKKRAFHFGGASWLLLCAMADGAMAQDAAAPSASTQLPEITVTAPSPIVRRRPAPPRTPARVARTAPGQNRQPAAEPQAAPVAAAPQQGVLPVVTDQFATVTVVPNEEIRRSGGGTLGDLLLFKARHHRLQLCAGRLQPADHPGPRRQPRRHRRERHRQQRRLRSRRRSFRADRSPATNQVEVIRGPATLRYGSTAIGGVVSATNNRIPDALPACAAAPFQSYGLPVKAPLADGAVPRLRQSSRPARPSVRSTVASKAPSCSMPAAAISLFMPTPMAAKPAITTFPAIPICSTRRGP